MKFYHRANNLIKCADAFYNPMIDNKEGHIPSPLMMFTCTALCHAPLEWQKNKDVHPKASKSKLDAYRTDYSNYFNCKNERGKIVSYCAEMGRKLLKPRMALQTRIHSWWIPGTHYRRCISRGCITTLLPQSSVRSNSWRTQYQPWWSAWKQRLLTMLFFLTIWTPKLHFRNLGPEALTEISW